MKRKVIDSEIQQEIVKHYLDGWSMTDLGKTYKVSMASIRSVLQITMDVKSPCQARKALWKEGKFIPVHLQGRIDSSGKKSKKVNKQVYFKNIPIAVNLIQDKVISHSEIGRKHIVSREYVGQVAEALANSGLDVSRENNIQGRVAMRGTIS